MNKRILSSLVTAILIAAVLSVPQVQSGSVTVSLSPSTAHVGDTVTVSGTNPTPGGLVEVYWQNLAAENKLNETRSVVSSQYGYGYGYGYTYQYQCTIKVPEVAYGSYAIIVLDVQSGETGVATLNVVPKIVLSPTVALRGDTITVKGTGFTAGANVSKVIIDLGMASETDVTPSETVKINASGSFLCTFKVPSSLAYGVHTVTVNDTSGHSASAAFKVWATLALSVNKGPSGTIVDILGKGFTPKGNVTIKMDNTTCKTLGTIQANTSGIFTGKFIVPTLNKGVYTVNASDDGGNWSTATFGVTGKTAIKAIPAVAAPGDTITIKGYNFTAMKDVVVTIDFGALASYATVNTTENGEFTATITVPEVQVGTYTITAKDLYNLSASATFKVAITTLTILPTSGPTGTKIHLVGGGFEADKEFNATINGKLLVLIGGNKTDSNGAIDKYAYIPTVPAGTYTITVMDETGIKAEETFTVTETTQITVSPSSAPENYTVSIMLKYFTAAGNKQNTSVSLSMYNLTADGKVDWIYKDLWNNITIQAEKGYNNSYVDATGTYKGKFKVPQLDPGTYIINATDANGLKANVTFEIVQPTVLVYTGADEYLPGDRVSFFAKCTYSYLDRVINLYTPSGFKITITDLDIATKIGNYFTGTVSYILPADAETGTWTWNATIGGVTVEGSFTVTTRTTAGALEERILKLKSDVSSLSEIVSRLSSMINTQASDISKLSGSVSTLSSAVGDLSSTVSSLKEDVAKLAEDVKALSSAISAAQSAAQDASKAASNAQSAVSGIQMAVYGAVILSLIAAVAAIISIIIMQRKIAG